MEAVAKTVEVLSKRLLPEKPHTLSFHPDWRYRPPPEHDKDHPDASRGARRRFEEWHNTRLQYLTFLSEADRGTLLTRPYYDMREEPPKPVHRDIKDLGKPLPGAPEKKKLSLSDYKNKKTGDAASTPDPAAVKDKEKDRVANATPTPSTEALTLSQGVEAHGDSRARESSLSVEDKMKKTVDTAPADMRFVFAPHLRQGVWVH